MLTDVNTSVLVNQPDAAEMLATKPMSYVLAFDDGLYLLLNASWI